MSRSVPDRARTLAAALMLRFAQDAQLATRLNDFHQRLQRANERLWSGLHPDGIAAVYDEQPTQPGGPSRTLAWRTWTSSPTR